MFWQKLFQFHINPLWMRQEYFVLIFLSFYTTEMWFKYFHKQETLLFPSLHIKHDSQPDLTTNKRTLGMHHHLSLCRISWILSDSRVPIGWQKVDLQRSFPNISADESSLQWLSICCSVVISTCMSCRGAEWTNIIGAAGPVWVQLVVELLMFWSLVVVHGLLLCGECLPLWTDETMSAHTHT